MRRIQKFIEDRVRAIIREELAAHEARNVTTIKYGPGGGTGLTTTTYPQNIWGGDVRRYG